VTIDRKVRIVKRSISGTLLLLAAGLVAGLLATTASATGARMTTIHLIEKDSSFHFVSNSPHGKKRGPSAGDVFVFSAELLTQAKKHAGTLHATCTVVSGGRHPISTCVGTFGLQGGQLQAQTTITDGAKADHIAIVGGTGAYVGARGEVISVSRGENSPFSDDTVHLLSA
jgi:hypothetical protein